jgi:hypothetical protein
VPRIQSQQHIRQRERAEKNGTILCGSLDGPRHQVGTCTSFFRELRPAFSVEESTS